jgi:hypothetical protein
MHGGVSSFLLHACCRKGQHDGIRGEAEEGRTAEQPIPSSSSLVCFRLFARTAAKPRVALNERIDCKKDGTASTAVPLPLLCNQLFKNIQSFLKRFKSSCSCSRPSHLAQGKKSKSKNIFPRPRQDWLYSQKEDFYWHTKHSRRKQET